MRYSFVLSIIIVAIAGCAKVSEEKLLLEAKAQEICTKDTMSFQQHVQPIIQSACMPCHNSGQAEAGVILETHAQISGIGTPGGLLLGVIKHEPGFLAMPKDRPKLGDCEIRAIEIWVTQGAMNN